MDDPFDLAIKALEGNPDSTEKRAGEAAAQLISNHVEQMTPRERMRFNAFIEDAGTAGDEDAGLVTAYCYNHQMRHEDLAGHLRAFSRGSTFGHNLRTVLAAWVRLHKFSQEHP